METQISKGAHARLLTLACAVLLGSGAAAEAEPAPSFLMLLQQARDAAPRLAESAANIQTAEGLALQATARPNPAVSLELENIGQNGGPNGLANMQTTLSVNQPIELGGKRSARISAGQAGVGAAQARNRQIVIDFGYDLAVAYAGAEAAQARTVLLEDAVMAAQEDLRAAMVLVNAGREADLRSVQAQSEAATAQADLEAARAQAQNAFAQLANLAGASRPYTGVTPSLLPLAGNLPASSAEPPVSTPAIAAAEAERDAAARRVDVERTRATPDVTASLGLRRVEAFHDTLVVGGLSVPLPLFDKNRGNIAAALGQFSAAEARLNAARLEAENGYRAAQAQASAANARVAASTQAQAAAEEAYRLARIGYDAGRTPLVELLIARRNLTTSQSAALDARLARLNAEAALARLSGRIPFGENP
jgi:cobalt-zinc-cadmium efflux system outer membrane protein